MLMPPTTMAMQIIRTTYTLQNYQIVSVLVYNFYLVAYQCVVVSF
jgi:hypothetical protein